MAYGTSVSDASASLLGTGTDGYIVRFNLTSVEPRTITQVQAFDGGTGAFSDVIATESSLADLYDYLNDAAPAVDIAFAQKDEYVDVFLKESTFPYTANTRVGLFYQVNAANLTDITDANQFLDIPQEARILAEAKALEQAYKLKATKPTPQNIQVEITSEMERLGLTTG